MAPRCLPLSLLHVGVRSIEAPDRRPAYYVATMHAWTAPTHVRGLYVRPSRTFDISCRYTRTCSLVSKRNGFGAYI